MTKQTKFKTIDELLSTHQSFKPTKKFDDWVKHIKTQHPNTMFGINTFFVYGFEKNGSKSIETGSFSINNQTCCVK